MRQKCYHERRNVKIGDFVLISDKDLKRGEWKLGKISKVEQGIDGKVRWVTVQYKNRGSDVFSEIERPVQRVVVIHAVDEQ